MDTLRNFLRLEAASGIILIFAMGIALLAANSPLAGIYDLFLSTRMEFRLGTFELSKPLLLWINDGLMAIFFLLIGLEVKREVLVGELSSPAKIVLPAFAAAGGMLVPALIYVFFNPDGAALQGWAIPAATDIAFALGVLALVGSRVPAGIKVFLMTLAILDDLAAIVIIALFYTSGLSWLSLSMAALSVMTLVILNRSGVRSLAPYLLTGAFLWVCVLKSGVHATLAGVILAFAIPFKGGKPEEEPPLLNLEHGLHPWVAFGILPVFAFANAGIPLAGFALNDLLSPLTLGIALGLLIGKPLGIVLLSWLAVALKAARLPDGIRWHQFIGMGVLCGVGFTMSLFISSLAFEHGAEALIQPSRLGILVGSLLSATLGYLLLRFSPPAKQGNEHP